MALLIGAFLFGVSSGGGAAWWVQGLRVTSAEQDFTSYKQNQTRILQEHNENAAKQRQESALAYEAAKQQLSREIEAGDVYRRCVAAGRCGVRVVTNGLCKSSGATGNGLQTASRIDDASADAISTAGKLAEECAVTTLQLNQLQANIEGQEAY